MDAREALRIIYYGTPEEQDKLIGESIEFVEAYKALDKEEFKND